MQQLVVYTGDISFSKNWQSFMGFLGVQTLGTPLEDLYLSAAEDRIQGAILPAFNAEQIQTLLAHRPGLPIHIFSDVGEQDIQRFETWLSASEPEPPFNQIELFFRQVKAFANSRAFSSTQPDQVIFDSLAGESASMMSVKEFIARVAHTEATVLIEGDTGTGKEVIARNIHINSTRKNKAFVAVNCGAIPGELLESELFGHEKGAFTGAIASRQGRFELAKGGTLFLDEIGDMPLMMQVKLLRVLQERSFERVGSSKSMEADVRVIAATHRNLEQAIEAGTFREDLYYRLNVFPIHSPALRERLDDLPMLIDNLVSRMERDNRGRVDFSVDALKTLQKYPWPGNVRELANVLERMAILYPDCLVDVAHLPDKYRPDENNPPSSAEIISIRGDAEPADAEQGPLELIPLTEEGMDMKAYLADLEKSLIVQSLDLTQGVVAKAARLLQIQRTTLVEKMRKYDI